jgi:hypothetical protein
MKCEVITGAVLFRRMMLAGTKATGVMRRELDERGLNQLEAEAARLFKVVRSHKRED